MRFKVKNLPICLPIIFSSLLLSFCSEKEQKKLNTSYEYNMRGLKHFEKAESRQFILSKGILKMAIDDFTNAIQIDSLNPQFYYNRAKAYLDYDYFGSQYSIDDLSHAIKLCPDFSNAHVLLGQIHLFKCNYNKSNTCFKNAIRADSAGSYKYHLLGSSYLKMAEYDSAIYYFNKAIKKGNQYSEILKQKAINMRD